MEPKGNLGVEHNREQHEFSIPLEQTPETPLVIPERYQESKENYEPAPRHTPADSALPQAVTLPTPVPTVSDDDNTAVVDDTTPASAGDEDLIEKEWVDKAKKIIEETRNDPHKRELEVNKLQSDYLKKRYGKDLGNAA